MYIYIGVAIPLVIFVIVTFVGIKVRKHQKFRYLERPQSTEDPDNTTNFYNNIRIQRPNEDM